MGKKCNICDRTEYLRKRFSVRFDVKVCQPSERFAAWVVVIEGREKERTPVITLITAPLRARPPQNIEKNVACRNLLPELSQENSNNILVGLYPPLNETTI